VTLDQPILAGLYSKARASRIASVQPSGRRPCPGLQDWAAPSVTRANKKGGLLGKYAAAAIIGVGVGPVVARQG